jgi:hypothetical protein
MNNGQRALQLWSVLALAAKTRTILTYEEVAALTGLPNDSAIWLACRLSVGRFEGLGTSSNIVFRVRVRPTTF